MRLGDVVLLLPALARLKACYPGARLTLLTDERCAPLAMLSPSIDEVIPVNRLGMRDGPVLGAFRDMIHLVKDIRRRHFDLVIDLLSFRETNLLTWFSGARYRVGLKRYGRGFLSSCFNMPAVSEDKTIHVADMFLRVVASVTGPCKEAQTGASVLGLPEATRQWVRRAGPPQPFISLYVGAPVAVRRWPAENFALVADFIVEKLGTFVAVLAGEPEEEMATRVQKLCRHPDRVHVFASLALPELVALIASSSLLVSNDTGPMHIGPAFNVPTLGLFSVGYPEHYRPLGSRSRFLQGNPIEDISVQSVERTIMDMS